MTDTTFDGTIDWNDYWTDADEEGRSDASPSARFVLEPLCEFLAARDPPQSVADVGCGTGTVAFDVARRYPDADVVGYDAAESILEDNRDRASADSVDNVRFERAVLPGFTPDRRFDVVTCFYTLCYVANVERALERLYDAVAPGGWLVFSYHNRLAQSVYCGMADSPDEHLGQSSSFDPQRYPERFQLLLEGTSLLSYERIHDALGTWPRSVWSAVDEADRYPAWRHNPLVYVPK